MNAPAEKREQRTVSVQTLAENCERETASGKLPAADCRHTTASVEPPAEDCKRKTASGRAPADIAAKTSGLEVDVSPPLKENKELLALSVSVKEDVLSERRDSDSQADDEADTDLDTDDSDGVEVVRRSRTLEWRLPCVVGQHTVKAVVDSGAMRSLVSSKLWEKLGRDDLHCTMVEVRGVGGGKVPVLGNAVVEFEVVGERFPLNVLIIDTQDDVILGADFLSKQNVMIDFGKGEIRLGRAHVMLEKDTDRSQVLATRRGYVIPPNSECVVPVNCRRRRGTSKPSVVMPEATCEFMRTGLVLGRAVVDTRKPCLLILNASDDPVEIPPLQRIAVGRVIEGIAGAVQPASENSKPIDYTRVDQPIPEHLSSLVTSLELPDRQLRLVTQLILEYEDIFAGKNLPPGRTDTVKHAINTGEQYPVRVPKRRIPLEQQKIIKTEVDKMIDLGVVEPSESPWTSPVVLVKKKDGSLRFCVDYRQLNRATEKDSYPLPNIEDTFNALTGAQYFSSLDLASGYWQVELEEKAKAKTAFATREGLFQFTVMPFGLCNAPATFERLMERVLNGLLWDRCMCYLDDIIVYGTTFQMALENLKTVFDRVRKHGLRLQPKKCDLFKKEVLYLGFFVNEQGVRPDPKKIEAVKTWPEPCSLTDVRSFLGFCNYHRRFVQNYAAISEPLQWLTRTGNRFHWGIDQQTAFDALKEAMLGAPMLPHPRMQEPVQFVLDTDASLHAMGGVLSQRIDGKEYVLSYASKTFSKPQRNYCATYRELLAALEMIRHFRHYLWGRHFELRTDHASLRWLSNYKNCDGMLARWLASLQEYDYKTVHRAGKLHTNADGLSRCHTCQNPQCIGRITDDVDGYGASDVEMFVRQTSSARSGDDCPPGPIKTRQETAKIRQVRTTAVVDDSDNMSELDVTPRERHTLQKLDTQIDQQRWLEFLTDADLAAAQVADPGLAKVRGWLLEGRKPTKAEIEPESAEVKALAGRWRLLSLQNDVVSRTIVPRPGKVILQKVLPQALRVDVLHQLHDLRVTGHLGIQRTVERVKQRFYWPGLSLDVARWCASCEQCAGRKGKPRPRKQPMQTFDVGAPFERISIDILDTHKVTRQQNRYVLVVTDYFTKWTDAFPLKRHTARIVAHVLVNRWFVYHGVPRQVLSDQGPEFEGRLFQRLAKLLEIRKIRTSPYRPQTDGQVERFNRTLLNMLSAFVTDTGLDWDQHIPYVMMAYRTSVNSSTGCTPQVMVYGQEANLPIDLVYDTQLVDLPKCPQDYVEFLKSAIQGAHTFAREHLKKAAMRRKRYYDRNARKREPFEENALVRYYYPPVRQQSKFGRPWIGPWRVVKQVSEEDYLIELVANPKKRRVVHHDVLKPLEVRDDVILDYTSDPDSDRDTREQLREELVADLKAMMSPWEEGVNDREPSSSSSSEEESSPLPRRRGLRPRGTIQKPSRFQ